MTQKHTRRHSEHPWIDAVWQTVCLTDGIYKATPDGSWDLIRSDAPDRNPLVFLTGQATVPVDVPYLAHEHSVVISLSAHVYLVQDHEARTGAVVRMLDVQGDHFMLNGVVLPLPTFDNAEALVTAMVAADLLSTNDIVARAFTARPKPASPRAVQQNFKKITGITQKDFQLIRRAQEAVRRLKAGEEAVAVALDLGYTDQPHMIKSIKKIMGSTPSDLEGIHKI